MSLAPIVLFVFNRPWHTRQTLEALSQNELAAESDLYIFSDGAKESGTENNVQLVEEVRKVIREKKWCGTVHIFESNENKGLAKSVIDGVTQIVNQYKKIIVLEDDLVSSPFFLRYMNNGLDLYEKSFNVYSVNGYMFPIETNKNESILLPYTSSWGWATWADKWASFRTEMPNKDVLVYNPFLKSRFNIADYPYTSMLDAGSNSWGIRWYYCVFSRNGLGVFPTQSLIYNAGFDGSGINYTSKKKIAQTVSDNPITVVYDEIIDLIFFGKYLLHFQAEKESIGTKVLRKIMKTVRGAFK